MTATLKIDRDSLADVIRELVEDDGFPMDPCLVWDSATGVFSIESSLTPREATEYIVCDRIGDSWLESDAEECRQNLERTREAAIEQHVADSMAGMDDDYIAQYVIGDLSRFDTAD